ncbi:MAG: DnaJ domain-containing protein [Bacteroidales bacterium]
MVNLYSILGVSESADQKEIKRAYRRLAVKYHPDSSGDQASSMEFIKINKAYQVLSVPSRRAWYDHRLSLSRQNSYHPQQKTYRTRTPNYESEARRKAKAESATRYRQYIKTRHKETPLLKRKDFRISVASLFLIILFFFFMNDIRYIMLKRHDTTTMGIVTSPYSFNNDSRNLHYSYSVNDSVYKKHESRPTNPSIDQIITDDNIPVRRGYKFLVWYNPNEPQRGFIDFKYPDQNTILKVQKRAVQMLMRQTSFSQEKAACFVNELYKEKGLEGVGIILCSEYKWYENFSCNSNSFRKFRKSKLWKKIKTQKCVQDSLTAN